MKAFSSKEIFGGVLLVALFAAALVLARTFSDDIVEYFNFGMLGMIVYVIAGITATVIAPLSMIPFIPFAVELWGPFVTAVLSILAWTGGAVIAFALARYLGQPFVERLVDIEKIAKYEKVLGEEHLFWNIAFMRMALPVDILSYAIGLFTSIRPGIYLVATVVGITPFAFLFSYASDASLSFQLAVGVVVIIMIYAGYRRVRRKMV